MDDTGEPRFRAVTRAAAEEARAYLWKCMEAGLQPQWLRPRRAVNPATGELLPTLDEVLASAQEKLASAQEQIAALKAELAEWVEKPQAALGRKGGTADREIVWNPFVKHVFDENPAMPIAEIIRRAESQWPVWLFKPKDVGTIRRYVKKLKEAAGAAQEK